jgi:hypothetical protein
MRRSRLKIERLASGGIITNYFCTSACRHCLYNCSPRWEKNYISVEIAEENFRPFHNEHIPLARTQGVMDACHQAGVRIFSLRL